VGFSVSDYERSKAFCEKALAPLGLKLLMEPVPGIGGFGDGQKPFFWIGTRGPAPQSESHVAFPADSREIVDAFHAAAPEAGATDNGYMELAAVFNGSSGARGELEVVARPPEGDARTIFRPSRRHSCRTLRPG
jgi:hypothetical protein